MGNNSSLLYFFYLARFIKGNDIKIIITPPTPHHTTPMKTINPTNSAFGSMQNKKSHKCHNLFCFRLGPNYNIETPIVLIIYN